MADNFVRAISADQVAPGGMKSVDLGGQEIVICNCGGTFYAIQRRCGHMNAPLDLGTLDGTIVTCAMHCAQFDVTTGHALSGPVPGDLGNEPIPPRVGAMLQNVGMLMQQIRTENVRTYKTKVEGGWVNVAV
ncbi:MAG TPA: Rieske 2Fe-2S domain-containing protein [Candidatus Acidoferrales bacterium]|nr:Rieske 2Fe-2S domain-containing protein [Candidatus Acidoferrales bacterium]